MATQQASRVLLPRMRVHTKGKGPVSPGSLGLGFGQGPGKDVMWLASTGRGEGPLCRIFSSGHLELGSDSPQPEAGSVAQPASSSEADKAEGGVAGPGYGDSSHCLFTYLSPRLAAQAEVTPARAGTPGAASASQEDGCPLALGEDVMVLFE